jgi:hypothetical protein
MNYEELKKKHPDWNWEEAEEASSEELEAAADLYDNLARQKRQEYLRSITPTVFTGHFRPSKKTNLGTGFKGYLETSFEELVKHFGMPNGEGDDYKVSTEWILEDEKGRIVTIYDYKETNLYSRSYPSVEQFRKRKSYQWHIGAQTTLSVELLVKMIENE